MLKDSDERVHLAKERTLLANERNRLANQRTFLAWVRTGLATVAGGLAIVRYLTFNTESHRIVSQIVGCILVLLGIGIFSVSFFDYKSSYKKLKVKGGYAGSLWMISSIAWVLAAVSIVLLLIVFGLI